MVSSPYGTRSGASHALWLSTAAYTVCFSAWTLLSIIGLEIERKLTLSDTGFGLLIATPILAGSLARVVLALLVDRFGVRYSFVSVTVIGAAATFLLSFATTQLQLLITGLAVGIVGASLVPAVAHVVPDRAPDPGLRRTWCRHCRSRCNPAVCPRATRLQWLESGRADLGRRSPVHGCFPLVCIA